MPNSASQEHQTSWMIFMEADAAQSLGLSVKPLLGLDSLLPACLMSSELICHRQGFQRRCCRVFISAGIALPALLL